MNVLKFHQIYFVLLLHTLKHIKTQTITKSSKRSQRKHFLKLGFNNFLKQRFFAFRIEIGFDNSGDLVFNSWLPIDDCAKDGGEEFLPSFTAFFNQIPIELLKICNSNVVHLGKKFLSAIFSAILYYEFTKFPHSKATIIDQLIYVVFYQVQSTKQSKDFSNQAHSSDDWKFENSCYLVPLSGLARSLQYTTRFRPNFKKCFLGLLDLIIVCVFLYASEYEEQGNNKFGGILKSSFLDINYTKREIWITVHWTGSETITRKRKFLNFCISLIVGLITGSSKTINISNLGIPVGLKSFLQFMCGRC